MYQPNIVIVSPMAHGHGPPHFERQLECTCVVVFVIFMRTHPTYYCLESSGSTRRHGNSPLVCMSGIFVSKIHYV